LPFWKHPSSCPAQAFFWSCLPLLMNLLGALAHVPVRARLSQHTQAGKEFMGRTAVPLTQFISAHQYC
jgi:hypothetical protein